ncbi:class I SAM-dependent methyltransferase [Cellulomonas endophytica]|uniref:class I SAM-dependent methyltransferase n=1 Tax=Cellulomonas endophytica TaxID=2494735 RepID=UPI0013E92B92|nr:class I SAM-dependent methyltransferase [Cellulomonas endophytica]
MALLDPAPDARVLEVGCGVGHALALLAPRLPEGHVTGLDRSASALGHAEGRLRRWLEEGRVDLQHRELSAFHGDGRGYDAVLAVNVNAFWTDPTGPEASRVVDLLLPGGDVVLAWEPPPGHDEDPRVRQGASAALARTGVRAEHGTTDGVLWVRARVPG